MERFGKSIIFAFANFGPLIVFYVVNHFYGLRPAVITTIAFTLAEFAHLKLRKKPVTKIFIFAAGMTLIFGALDLIFAQGLFVKLEPVITNFITAGFFAYTVWSPQSIIQMIAEQNKQSQSLDSPDKRFFFRVITSMWVVYFVVKAGLYLRFNLQNSIEDGLIFRAIVGNGSFFVMLGLSFIGARPLRTLLYRWQLMPSQRGSSQI